MRTVSVESSFAEQMKDEEFRKAYEALQPEFDYISAQIERRLAQSQYGLLARLAVKIMMFCDCGCHYREPYGWVVMAGCRWHD